MHTVLFGVYTDVHGLYNMYQDFQASFDQTTGNVFYRHGRTEHEPVTVKQWSSTKVDDNVIIKTFYTTRGHIIHDTFLI